MLEWSLPLSVSSPLVKGGRPHPRQSISGGSAMCDKHPVKDGPHPRCQGPWAGRRPPGVTSGFGRLPGRDLSLSPTSSQWEPLLGCGFWRSPCRKWPFVPGERNPPTPPRTAARRQAAHLDLCPQSSPLLPGPPCITIGAGVSVKTGGRAALPGTLPRWPPHPPPPESALSSVCARPWRWQWRRAPRPGRLGILQPAPRAAARQEASGTA